MDLHLLPEGLSTVADEVDALWNVILVVTLIAFFATQGVLVWLLFKFRAKDDGRRATMRSLYRRLLELRRTLGLGSLEDRATRRVECREDIGVLTIERRLRGGGSGLLAMNTAGAPTLLPLRWRAESVRIAIDTGGREWDGQGETEIVEEPAGAELRLPGRSAVLLLREDSQ